MDQSPRYGGRLLLAFPTMPQSPLLAMVPGVEAGWIGRICGICLHTTCRCVGRQPDKQGENYDVASDGPYIYADGTILNDPW